MKTMNNDPDMLEEYDFSKGIRGKYSKCYAEGTMLLLLNQDLVQYFPDNATVMRH